MIVETRVWIIGRLLEIGYELKRLSILPPSERKRTAKACESSGGNSCTIWPCCRDCRSFASGLLIGQLAVLADS